MAKEQVVSSIDAIKILDDIEEEFGALPPEGNRAIILDAIERGLLEFISADAAIKYRLEKPVEKCNPPLTVITLVEPTIAQIQRINKGLSNLIADSSGKIQDDAEHDVKETLRILSVIGQVPEGTVYCIKRRDYAVLREIAHFFS